ncbi:MAG: GDP-mannose 4,6-dehydratase [Acidimicrobiia bacterium]|jgi:GDP-4-dehydro-6-deoxy-D-mannose reductase|nr:GDP-mannose 4,6-dehydratase [Acidimicrobiia bacterium]MBP8181037.1 GDP-mannose 4,6-dehydratase [Acidimicrobiia bacterium]
MRAYVTGASGFVGQYLVPYLRACGDQVVAPGTGDEPKAPDICAPEELHAALQHAQPEVVYHLAAQSNVRDSWDDPGGTFDVNARGTLNLLRACIDAGVRRVLIVGSSDCYGAVSPEDLPLTERSELNPLTPYAASKIAAEYIARQWALAGAIETVSTRSFSHTGPGQRTAFVVPGFAQRIRQAVIDGTDKIRVGNLDPVRDFTDVRDVIRAYRMLMENGSSGQAYNVCSGVGRSVNEIAERLISLSGHRIELEVDPSLVRPVEVPQLVGSPAKLKDATGWEPSVPFEQTLLDVYHDAPSNAGTAG